MDNIEAAQKPRLAEESIMRIFRFRTTLIALLTVVAGTAIRAGDTDPAKVTINDEFAGAQVLGDQTDPNLPTLYTDHRLAGGDPCVTAWGSISGIAFVHMDWRSDLGSNCAAQLGVTQRNYKLRFLGGPGSACEVLSLQVDPTTGMCEFTVTRAPRLRIEKLFRKKGQTTPVNFLLIKDGTSYEVRMDEEVPFTVSGNARTVTNTLVTAKLWVIAGPRTRPVSNAFPFVFQLTVERVP